MNKKIETINNAIDRLQASYECNHEFMDADDIGSLLTTIEDLKAIRDDLQQIWNRVSSTKTELIAEYVPGYDHTFIMEATYVNDECVTMECVGWYCGEPNEIDTELFANHCLKADYRS